MHHEYTKVPMAHKANARMRAKKLTITIHIFLFFAVVLGSGIVDVNIDPVLGYNGDVGFGISHVDEHELLWVDLRCGVVWFCFRLIESLDL